MDDTLYVSENTSLGVHFEEYFETLRFEESLEEFINVSTLIVSFIFQKGGGIQYDKCMRKEVTSSPITVMLGIGMCLQSTF